jgi:hypothetical protein
MLEKDEEKVNHIVASTAKLFVCTANKIHIIIVECDLSNNAIDLLVGQHRWLFIELCLLTSC